MRHCELCGKTSQMGGTRKLLRGHYNPTNWTRKYPNLQKALTPDGQKVLACTQCIRTMGKEARMAEKKAKKAELKARAAERAAKVAQAPAKKPEKKTSTPKKKTAAPKKKK